MSKLVIGVECPYCSYQKAIAFEPEYPKPILLLTQCSDEFGCGKMFAVKIEVAVKTTRYSVEEV